jgi:hypothetical protein
MIALVTTYFLVFYILIPGAVFRFATSFSSVKLKSFQRTRTQEATFAVSVSIVPFLAALIAVWYLPISRIEPFQIEDRQNSTLQRSLDYHYVGEMIVAPDVFKQASCAATPCPTATGSKEVYRSALDRVLHRQARFLTWFFVVTFAEGLAFGLFASKYGDWLGREKNQRNHLIQLYAIRLYAWFTRKFVLPNISEWHVLLTGFNWPKGALVVADVLQSDGHLYRGRVEDYFIDPEGKFTGLLLHNVERFDLNSYRRAQETDANPQTLASENFWKTIPSENFYISQNSISNLNLRFAPGADKSVADVSLEVLILESIRGKISVEEPLSGTDGEDDEDPSAHPDIYS